MSKTTYSDSEKTSRKQAGFLNPSKPTTATGVKTAVGVLAGAWALKNYPKIAVFGLIGVGVILGLTLKEVARSVEAFPRSKDHLH